MSGLNSQQLAAVECTDGPVLVLAGAGSGKTRVLTHKITHLIKQKLAYPENILAVTFTNKAANEIKQRVNEMLGSAMYFNWLGTFHSICVKILKTDGNILGYSRYFTIYDTNDQLQLVRNILAAQKTDSTKFPPKAILNMISNAKNELIEPDAYADNVHGPFMEKVAMVYPQYQKFLKDNNAFDFDDLIMKTVELFLKSPAVLDKYQELFHYILIDEYQDTNHAQYKLAKLLASKHKNITVVGDDAQSIYSFRGANIRNILDFERDYPDATVILLEQNYRSTKKILDASNHIISLNSKQKQKKLWTENADGEDITIYKARDEKDESEWIAQKIETAINTGTPPSQIAVLYRTNAQSRTIEEAMIRHALDYQIVGGIRFYDRKEIKDAICYLQIAQNMKDNLSLERIINVPRRGIGPKSFATLVSSAAASGVTVVELLINSDPSVQRTWGKGVRDFAGLVKHIFNVKDNLNVRTLLEDILETSGYLAMLNDGDPDNEGRLENIQELITLADQFSSLPAEQSLEEFLSEVALIQDQYRDDGSEIRQKVTLMSIHAAKGLEFDRVFVAGMEEGMFPHSRSYNDPSEMEEERRLAYVAMTRAKKKLHLTHAESRHYFGNKNSNIISRFASDIPEELVDKQSHLGYIDDWKEVDDFDEPTHITLEVGDRVKHDSFGIGLVKRISESYVVISFPRGIKELSLEYARLTKL